MKASNNARCLSRRKLWVTRCMAAAFTVTGMFGILLVDPIPSLAVSPRPHWSIASEPWPAYFKPGDESDVLTLTAVNNGGEATDGSVVTLTDVLPPGVTATKISGQYEESISLECKLSTLSCTYNGGPVFDGANLTMTIMVKVSKELGEAPSSPRISNAATIFGGGAPPSSVRYPFTISTAPVPFGFSNYTTEFTDASGSLVRQAGAHPFQSMTYLALNVGSVDFSGNRPTPFLSTNEVKDVEVALPPGLVGDPSAVPKCTQVEFLTTLSCPVDTQVGVVQLYFYSNFTARQNRPVYNIEPPENQPAELGFRISLFSLPILFRLRNEGDYGLVSQLNRVTEADPIQASRLILWGVPADPAHDSERSNLGSGACEEEGHCDSGGGVPMKPFLTVPTSCQSSQLTSGVVADSWQEPGRRASTGAPDLSDPRWVQAEAPLPAMTGCGNLSFNPAIAVEPEVTQAGTPTGYTIHLRIPQRDEPSELATPDLKKAVVTLPAGTVISPSAADGLVGCSDEQFGLHSTGPAICPAASQVGRLKITTPLLSEPLEGQVFVGTPNCSPCSAADAQGGRMLRVFLQARGAGVTVKLEGSASVNQGTGQLMTTFDNNPQLPFSELELVLNGGSRAPLANPSACGAAATTTDLTPWSSPETPDATPSSSFEVTGCGPHPFSPSFAAGTVNNQAGAFSSFTTTFSRQDTEQDLSGIQIKTPPGLLGMLSSVPLCGEPDAARGSCPSASEIGHTTVGAGPGGTPIYLPIAGQPANPVYLTTGYRGAPYGLSVAVPAVAGPFNLGTVIVRASINVDPRTSQIIVTSDPLPTILDGIPLHVRTVNVTVDRPGFMFNPTDCEELAVGGTIASTQGAAAPVSSSFRAANCATLKFAPRFTMSTGGKASKTGGASLDVKVASKGGPQPGGGEANIRTVKVDLPKQLPSRLTTLQKACLASVFDANPANCPRESNVGTATAATPVLTHKLTGPAYLVSHGGAAFPDLEIVLQGEGIALVLDGSTSIKKGVTSSTFKAVPDAPISSFELKLPTGKYSVLTATLPAKAKFNLCGQSLVAPTAITGQNGAVVHQNTKIGVTGCPKTPKKARKATRHKK